MWFYLMIVKLLIFVYSDPKFDIHALSLIVNTIYKLTSDIINTHSFTHTYAAPPHTQIYEKVIRQIGTFFMIFS